MSNLNPLPFSVEGLQEAIKRFEQMSQEPTLKPFMSVLYGTWPIDLVQEEGE